MLYRLVYCVLKFFKRFPYAVPLLVLAIVLAAFGGIIYAKIYQNWDRDPDRGAIAIADGLYGESYSTPRYLEQGWTANDSLWFYNTSQGSGLLPYDLFVVLRQRDSDELFRSDKNIDRFRYLPQKKTFFNPDALPLGFVKMTYRGKDYLGYTCAACHTGQINYRTEAERSANKPAKAVRIDGGPAMADMVGFLEELEKAMIAAQNGEKQKRFVADVLNLKNNYSTEREVLDDLNRWKNSLRRYNIVNYSKVEYGHARLDAFGRIYNRVAQYTISRDQLAKALELAVKPGGTEFLLTRAQVDKVLEGLGDRIVFSDDDFGRIVERLLSPDPGYPGLKLDDFTRLRDQIFNSPDAPVSYPFLWDISHSDYLQWNGLAANAGPGPLGRNTGEVIGVFAILDWGEDKLWTWLRKFSLSALVSGQKNKKHVIDFKSSINLFNLQRLESRLRALKSPEWPFCRNDKREYYLPEPQKDVAPSHPKYCNGNDKRFNEDDRRQGELIYIDRCRSCHTVVDRSAWDRIVVSHMSDVRRIGTDPAMAENSVRRDGKSGNFMDTYQKTDVGNVIIAEDAPVVQILTAATRGVIATPDADKWWPRRLVEWLYALVMSFADNTIKESVKNGDYNPDTTSQPYASLQAYKGRSLNGIWATAPYLHNGSVPTLSDLLLPVDRRPKSFKVGSREFDPEKVGFRSADYDGTTFNTDVGRGNLNTGHDKYCHKDEPEVPGGGCLTDKQREQLVEYLKSL